MRTKSERLFESFCDSRGVVWRRVPEMDEPRPDYEVCLGNQLILVEVKQLDPNPEERAAMRRREAGEQIVLGGVPGARLHEAIRSGNKQLRSLASKRCLPTLLVVYNNTPCSLHTKPYAVATAMRGLDAVDVYVPADVAEQPTFGPVRSGPRRTMSGQANTSTSAVVILGEVGNCKFELDVFHNVYASCPVDPELLRLAGVRQSRLDPHAPNSLEQIWREA